MKILIVKVSSLGDVVHNMPMVADIRRHVPDAQIDWVVEEGYVDLVRLNAGVDRIIPFGLRRWRRHLRERATLGEMRAFTHDLRRESYDLILETQGLLKTGLVMRLARLAPGGKRYGLANGTEGSGYEGVSRMFHSVSVPVGERTHAVLRSRLVAAAALGYEVSGPADFLLQAPQIQADWLPRAPYAVFFHGTARASKQWAQENWVRLAHALAARDLQVLLPWGSEAEMQTAQALARQMRNATVLPRLSMMEAVLLAQRAQIVIGVDTGLTHIAAAYGNHTIELYADSPRWKTEGDWSERIVNLGDRGNPPSVAEVEAALAHLLGRGRSYA